MCRKLRCCLLLRYSAEHAQSPGLRETDFGSSRGKGWGARLSSGTLWDSRGVGCLAEELLGTSQGLKDR